MATAAVIENTVMTFFLIVQCIAFLRKVEG